MVTTEGGEINGFYTPRSCFDLGVRVIPSIPAETVSLSGPLVAADVATLNSQQHALLDSLPVGNRVCTIMGTTD